MQSKIKAADEYLKEPYARLLIPDETGGYTAEILEFPGCASDGETANEAIENLENAAFAWIESTQKQGKEIPPPRGDYDFSGRIVVRLPASLHRQAALLAERDQTSLNQFLVSSIAASVGSIDMYHRIKDEIQKITFQMHATITVSEYIQAPQMDTATRMGPITIPATSFDAIGNAVSVGNMLMIADRGVKHVR